jgi:hypothetical protein
MEIYPYDKVVFHFKPGLLISHQFFHRGPTCARSRRARCGNAGGIAKCLAADGTASGSCWHSISLDYSPPGVSCSPEMS